MPPIDLPIAAPSPGSTIEPAAAGRLGGSVGQRSSPQSRKSGAGHGQNSGPVAVTMRGQWQSGSPGTELERSSSRCGNNYKPEATLRLRCKCAGCSGNFLISLNYEDDSRQLRNV